MRFGKPQPILESIKHELLQYYNSITNYFLGSERSINLRKIKTFIKNNFQANNEY